MDVELGGFLAGRDAPCPSCGYNLGGLQSGCCPECGRGVSVEQLRAAARRPVRNACAWILQISSLVVLALLGVIAVSNVSLLFLTEWGGPEPWRVPHYGFWALVGLEISLVLTYVTARFGRHLLMRSMWWALLINPVSMFFVVLWSSAWLARCMAIVVP